MALRLKWPWCPGGMVKTGWPVLKIGRHSAFGPNFPMEFGTLGFRIWASLLCMCQDENEHE